MVSQNGAYGSRLLSSDNTNEENVRMASVSMSLIGDKHQLLRLSTDRHEIMGYTYVEMMNDITRTMNAQGVPDTFQTEYKENLRDLQDACRVRWATMLSDLGTLEQYNRQAVDAMYACSTNALSDQLDQARNLRLHPTVHPLVRQDATSIGNKRPRSRSPASYSEGSSDHDDEESGAGSGIAPSIDAGSGSSEPGHASGQPSD